MYSVGWSNTRMILGMIEEICTAKKNNMNIKRKNNNNKQ